MHSLGLRVLSTIDICPRAVDNVSIVDKTAHKEAELGLLQRALAATNEAAGLQWHVLAKEPRDADFTLNLDTDRRKFTFLVEIKRRIKPDTLGLVVHQLARHGDRGLLVADYVTPPMADRLRKEGVQFIDAAGNAFIDAPPVFVWIKGEKPRAEQKTVRTPTRAFGATGLKVVFAVLCHPELVNRPYREIGEFAGVAHGTVGWVMPELQQLGFVAQLGDARRLLMVDRLIRQWAEAYIRVLRPKIVMGKFRTDTTDWWQTFDGRKYGITLAGEVAAAKLTRYLQPGTATFYGAKIDPRLIVDFKLKRDPQGDVEILKRFWNFDPDAPTVPVPLIYADLIRTNDARCLEAAQMLYDEFVRGFERKG